MIRLCCCLVPLFSYCLLWNCIVCRYCVQKGISCFVFCCLHNATSGGQPEGEQQSTHDCSSSDWVSLQKPKEH